MTAACWTDEDGTLHEVYVARVYVGNQDLGGLSYDSGREDLGWPRGSRAYFCPQCGDIWGRIVAQNSRGGIEPFVVTYVGCPAHGDRIEVPGSLLAGRLAGLLPSLPEAAVRRELDVLFYYWEKEIEK